MKKEEIKKKKKLDNYIKVCGKNCKWNKTAWKKNRWI